MIYSIIRLTITANHALITVRAAQASGNQPGTSGDLIEALVIIGALVLLFIVPVVFYVLGRRSAPTRSLLLVSTDENARDLVIQAAKRTGYRALIAYRYEDGLEKLRRDMTLEMIIVDDSVPQYEAGLLLAALRRLTIGVRPLILIHDSSELGQTAPSYRAEALVARPLSEKALENAIRQVADKIAPL